ncbi:MAG: sigma 54-interacting transcriptional regulator [Clostridiales Family XIII bacterium]|jgi:PAS domain S-box-containing protein|nr:sigma 54-interacting transcriptional regulator [Clostridiales Family XIII bacterium]
MLYGEIAEPLRSAVVLDGDGVTDAAPAASRKGSDTVDLRDFEQSETLLVTDADGLPVGTARKQRAAEAFLEEIMGRLSNIAEHMEPLGGDDYAGNLIFRRGSYNTAEDICGLIDAIAENNAKLLKILKFSSDSIFVADGKGVAIFVNNAFTKPSGAAKSYFNNLKVEELEIRSLVRPAITPMVIRAGKSITIMQQVTDKKTGLEAPWLVTGVPIFDGNGAIEMVVTNAKNVEEYERLKRYVENANKEPFEQPAPPGSNKIVCFGGQMRAAVEMAEKAAETDCTVLITGESGTGKGLLARHIHAHSERRGKSLVEVNCNSIPETLFESEFFGYETGAFTGAKTGGKPGLLEIAHGGTMFLDEIGDMALPLQAKLLKVLQDKRVTRVGGLKEIEVDVRIIAATNHSLSNLMDTGAFRIDLYYRLNMFPIHIAPLRERQDDIPALIDHFLRLYNAKHGKRTLFSGALISDMREWPWPGNVRQLEYFVERMVILHNGEIAPGDIPGGEHGRTTPGGQLGADITIRKLMPLKDALDETERKLFVLAAESGRSSYEIAKILDTSQTNAYRKIKKYINGNT